MEYLWLLLGAALILGGAQVLTNGASSLAKRYNVSDMVIGLTVVAFGTSVPELLVTTISAWRGSSEIAIGNVVGSNIFNTLAIVGCAAIVAPITVGKRTLTRDIPFGILAALVLFIVCNGVLINGDSQNVITRSSGFVLLCFFIVFMAYTFATAKSTTEQVEEIQVKPLWRTLCAIVVGLAASIGGGELFVTGATGIARSWGVSEAVIGLTIVACGTSLPELATSIVAAYKRRPGLALGNAIGSNIFNVFFVLGCGASIKPLSVDNITNVDLGVLLISSLILWVVVVGDYKIRRIEGILMFLLFVTYILYQLSLV